MHRISTESYSTPYAYLIARAAARTSQFVEMPLPNFLRHSTTQHRLHFYGLVLLIALTAILLIGTGATVAKNFSQYPGFAEYYASYPARSTRPTANEQALLHQFRPRVFVGERQSHPISFYDDYINNGTLVAGDGRIISNAVTPSILNAHKYDPKAVFTHDPDTTAFSRPVAFARIDRLPQSARTLGLEQSLSLTVLTYHFVFRESGLPAGLKQPASTLLKLTGGLNDWHQLDHYTAASVILSSDHTPIALMLQQHNYTRTYLFGEALPRPTDDRVKIDVAIRSNELYPHRIGRTEHRAIRFTDPNGMRYLMGFGKPPWIAAPDVTNPEREIDYELAFLPAGDAFYVFQGYLGARRLLPGRDGPPGADYNTLPEVKPLRYQLFAGYWRENNRDDLQRFVRLVVERGDRRAFASAQARIFLANMKCLNDIPKGCKLP